MSLNSNFIGLYNLIRSKTNPLLYTYKCVYAVVRYIVFLMLRFTTPYWVLHFITEATTVCNIKLYTVCYCITVQRTSVCVLCQLINKSLFICLRGRSLACFFTLFAVIFNRFLCCTVLFCFPFYSISGSDTNIKFTYTHINGETLGTRQRRRWRLFYESLYGISDEFLFSFFTFLSLCFA